MVLSATDAYSATTSAIESSNSEILQDEVNLATRGINSAIGEGLTYYLYASSIMGVPTSLSDDALTTVQSEFLQVFLNAGYDVSLNDTTSAWKFSWADSGAESEVSLYILKTTVSSDISASTISTIEDWFGDQTPIVMADVSLVSGVSDTAVGGTDSGTVSYVITTEQYDSTTDYSSDLLTELASTNLGYSEDNTAIVKIK